MNGCQTNPRRTCVPLSANHWSKNGARNAAQASCTRNTATVTQRITLTTDPKEPSQPRIESDQRSRDPRTFD